MSFSPLERYENRHHRAFEAGSYVRLGKLMTTSELSALRHRINALMLGRIRAEGIMFQLDGESAAYEKLLRHTVGLSKQTLAYRRVDGLHNDPLSLKYMQHSVLRQITQRYIGDDI